MGSAVMQRSFAGGEISPSMAGRADQVKYQTGLKTCRNFKVLKHGGVANRSGFRFINEVKNSSLDTYLMKFVFDDDQTYVIEVGNLYMRFYRDGARIVVSGVTAYNGATAYVIGNLASSAGVNYYCIAATTGNAPPNATYWYALTGTIYEIPTPYATAHLKDLTAKPVQSGDVVTLVHPSYAVRELTRTGHTAWTLSLQVFAPTNATPAGLAATAGAAGATVYRYKVTAVKAETYEESLPSTAAATAAAATPTSADPNTLTWTAVSGSAEYNVYRETADGSGTYAFIGVAGSNSFSDNNISPDTSITPPISRNPFNATGDYPGAASYYQQRLVLARTDNAIEKVWTSRTGMFSNLSVSSPLQDDDSVTFSLAGKKVQEIRHMEEVGDFVILTASGEWVVLGDSDGTLRANQPPNLKQIGSNGLSETAPVVIGNSLVYVQARGSVIRDLRNEVQAGGGNTYNGRDLTVFAGHLFKRKTIDRLDYAQIPDSIAYGIRSDGVLLGLTYLREHEVWGWHRHDTAGQFKDVCVVPEDDEDVHYVIARRYINGAWKQYIERSESREFEDITVDAIFMDSFLTYDGRNSGATTLTLSTGAGWTVTDTITVTAAAGTPFVAGDVGNWIVINIEDVDPDSPTYGEITATATIDIVTYTSTTVVSGTPSKTVPVAARGVATTDWSRAVDEIAGIDHLEGKDVSCFADGNVVASPNNDKYEIMTVASGAVTLARPASVIHIGLPYLSDFQTLDLDVQGEQIRSRAKNITHISLLVEDTRGLFAGPDADHLEELQPTPIEDYGNPWPLQTGLVEMNIASTWEGNGSFFVRQFDPLPCTILSAIPSTEMGG